MHKIKRSCLLLVLLAPSFVLNAQEEFIEDPSTFITKFYFRQLTGGVILMEAQFDDKSDTLSFILDTGSGGISLDSTTADYLELNPIPSKRTIRGIAGIRTVSFLYDKKLRIPGLVVDSLNFHINDYGILTAVYGEKIDGIIGYSFLSRYILKINYDSLKIEVWTKGSIKYPRGGYLMKPQITTLPVHSLRIRDDVTLNARFLYDMGAGLCIMLSTEFAKDSAVFGKKKKFFTKEAEGLGGKIDMQMTVMKEVKIGPYKFRKVPAYVFEDSFNVTSYPHLGGLIGNDLLRRFNVILNYDKREFYITPNHHYAEEFDYSYSGLELYMLNGNIYVGDVAKGSPAEESGVQEEDLVISVNKKFNNNLQQYKAELQNAGEKVMIIVQREGELLTFSFRVKTILR